MQIYRVFSSQRVIGGLKIVRGLQASYLGLYRGNLEKLTTADMMHETDDGSLISCPA